VVDDAIVVVENVEAVMERDHLPPKEAARKAMGQITGPVIGITLVLLSVFVPVAFIPGLTGQLYRQFAIAVSFSMVLSAINALTLSPALCSILLRPGHLSKGPMRYVMAGIEGMRNGYSAVVRRLVRLAVIGVLLMGLAAVGAGWLFKVVPGGFLPDEDQGAFFMEIALPQGSSVNRTAEVMRQIEEIVRPVEGVSNVTTVTGYSFLNSLAQSNSGFVIGSLAPFEERAGPALSA